MGKAALKTLIFSLQFIMCARSFCQSGAIQGSVTDWEHSPRLKATVEIRNERTHASLRLTTDTQGKFHIENLPSGTYTVEAWSKYEERASRSGIEVAPGSTEQVDFRLKNCRMTHINIERDNFEVRTETKADNDFEKDLAARAQQLPCRTDVDTSFPYGHPAPPCPNSEWMQRYFDDVKKYKTWPPLGPRQGRLMAAAYFGATVELDEILQQYVVKLRLEREVICGPLCGNYVILDRRVIFDLKGEVIKVDDDCGCVSDSVS